MTGTELEIIPPAHAEIAGSTAERLPAVHTNATTDLDLLAVWLKSHADGSHHTRRAYERIGHRFVEALAVAGSNLKRATVEDVQTALEAMRTKADGSTGSAAHAQHLRRRSEGAAGLRTQGRLHALQRGTAHQAQEGPAQNSATTALASRVAPAAPRREVET